MLWNPTILGYMSCSSQIAVAVALCNLSGYKFLTVGVGDNETITKYGCVLYVSIGLYGMSLVLDKS